MQTTWLDIYEGLEATATATAQIELKTVGKR